jgi:hypothetical protein
VSDAPAPSPPGGGSGGSVDAVWRRRDDVLWRRTLDAVLLFPPGADEPLTVAGSGALVWDLLAEPATLTELVDALASVYGDDPDTRAVIERDVATLLTDLEHRFGVAADPYPYP